MCSDIDRAQVDIHIEIENGKNAFEVRSWVMNQTMTKKKEF